MLVLFEMPDGTAGTSRLLMRTIVRRRNGSVEALRSMGAAAPSVDPEPRYNDASVICHTAATSFGRMIALLHGWRPDMANDVVELDQMQANYKAAVDEWIAAIEQEEALASVNHTVAELDKWEQAAMKEDAVRTKVKAAKKEYEDALREKFFGF
jgi:hypothetical protein